MMVKNLDFNSFQPILKDRDIANDKMALLLVVSLVDVSKIGAAHL